MLASETLSPDSTLGENSFGMYDYILELIHGIAWISAIEIFRLNSLTLAVAGGDFFRPLSLNVAGRVSSTKIAAWSKTSSMNDMRLGRSLESTLPACEGLLPADSVFSELELVKDSSAGWAGNSLMCNGSRRTRLPNGAIVDCTLRSAVFCVFCVFCCWMSGNKAKARKLKK